MVVQSSTQSQLVNSKDRGATDHIMDLVVGFRNSDGSYDLKRALTRKERTALETRRAFLVDGMQPAKPAFIIEAVLEMLIGFGGSRADGDDAKAMAAQYASVLSGLPGWAIKRSCVRWAMGHVSAEEVGEKVLNRTFAPSAALVRRVAEDILQPYKNEIGRINKTLKAKFEITESDEQRAANWPKIQAGLLETSQRLAEGDLREQQEERERNASAAARSREFCRDLILREYAARGLQPPPGTLVSLPTLLSMGWSISVDGNQKPVLIKLKRRKASQEG